MSSLATPCLLANHTLSPNHLLQPLAHDVSSWSTSRHVIDGVLAAKGLEVLSVFWSPNTTAPFLPARRDDGRAERDAVDRCRRGDPFLLEGGHLFCLLGSPQECVAGRGCAALPGRLRGGLQEPAPQRGGGAYGWRAANRLLKLLVCLCTLGPAPARRLSRPRRIRPVRGRRKPPRATPARGTRWAQP